VGRIPFKRFEVQLFNGVSVSATRGNKSEPGSYHIKIKDSSGTIVLEWEWGKDSGTRKDNKEDQDYTSLCNFLKELGITFHYLRDTRRVEGDVSSQRHISPRRMGAGSEEVIFVRDIDEAEEMLSPKRQLQHSIDAAIQWFRQQALSATNVGYTSVNSIYRDIIKRIVKPGRGKQNTLKLNAEELVNSLYQLKEKNNAFARFGLTPDLDIEDIIASLKSCKPSHISMLNTVLGPYLEGQQARLDALQELQRVMSSFVNLLCDFYSNKKTTIHLQQGLQIQAETGQELKPEMLSSGEKQLLLLFCNTISARKDKTILMIDEPEISLNVTWQRSLIPALLTCMTGTSFQIILATHSIEILAQYQQCVTPLDNKRK
jgi:ABC-type dipeptide/oligopeptide/nickel transport system ATPase component